MRRLGLGLSRIAADSALLQDSTLITTASGKKFGRDATDWKWWHHSVPKQLQKLHGEGYDMILHALRPSYCSLKSGGSQVSCGSVE